MFLLLFILRQCQKPIQLNLFSIKGSRLFDYIQVIFLQNLLSILDLISSYNVFLKF